MSRKFTLFVASLLLISSLASCATGTTSESNPQLESLQEHVASLEAELEEERTRPADTAEPIEDLSDELATLEGKLQAANQEKDDLQADLDLLASDQENLEADMLALQDDLSDKDSELQQLQADYDNYRDEMAVYEELSEQEAEARLIALAEEEAAREAEEQAEADRLAAEQAEREKLGYETGITFTQLARSPDNHIGDKVKFTGEILQVIEADDHTQYRFAINSDYDQVIYIEIDKSQTQNNRVLEDDVITIYGLSYGLITYKSTMSGDITIPAVVVDRFDR